MRISAALLLLALAACAPRPAPPPAAPPPLAAETLLESLAQSARAFGSLQGLARVRVTAEGRTLSGTQVLLVEKPDLFRAETLNPFGQPLLLMATDGDSLDVMIPAEGKFYRGEATTQNVQRFTRLPLRLTDLVHLLLYQTPVIDHVERSVEGTQEGGYLLTLADATGRVQKIRFNDDLQMIESAYLLDDALQLRITWGNFAGDLQSFPRAIAMHMPTLKAEGSLVFSEVRTNVAIPPERFSLTPPRGVEVLPMP